MVQESRSRELDKVIVRLPDGMRDRLKALAAENGRSLNAEIVTRLEQSLTATTEQTDAALSELRLAVTKLVDELGRIADGKK